MKKFFYELCNWIIWKFENPYNLNMPVGTSPIYIQGTLHDGKHFVFKIRRQLWKFEIFENVPNSFNLQSVYSRYDKHSHDFTVYDGIAPAMLIILITEELDRYYEYTT